uniref:hypothetical protein n=1 Tax=Lentinus flexipes TaxID=3163629 RepID=UPI0022653085|nr:hypothetical protein OSR58_mgp04 [Ganoderma flexipes]UYX56957.1 hypothetical protein [Ganoderma flexipes]
MFNSVIGTSTSVTIFSLLLATLVSFTWFTFPITWGLSYTVLPVLNLSLIVPYLHSLSIRVVSVANLSLTLSIVLTTVFKLSGVLTLLSCKIKNIFFDFK